MRNDQGEITVTVPSDTQTNEQGKQLLVNLKYWWSNIATADKAHRLKRTEASRQPGLDKMMEVNRKAAESSKKRNARIYKQYKAGVSIEDLEKQYQLKRRRLYEIFKEERQKKEGQKVAA